MKLTELDPKWLTPNILIFRCPCCKKVWLTCKNIVMKDEEQFSLLQTCHEPEFEPGSVVASRSDFAWNFPSSESFETLTVTPSIDASSSGHWHGWITNGEIR